MAASKTKECTTVEMESLEVPGEPKDASKKRKERMASDKKPSSAAFDGVHVPSNVPNLPLPSRTTNFGHANHSNSNSSGNRKRQFIKTRDVNPPRFLPLSSVHQPSFASVQRQYHYHQGINYSSHNYNPGLNHFKHAINKPIVSQRSVQSSITNNGHGAMSIGSQSSREGLLLVSSGDEELVDDVHQMSSCPQPFPFSTTSTDGTDVRQMEFGLLQLLDDFHLGKLQAFGKDITFEKMEQVREKQERLARLHFELMASNGSSGQSINADGNGNSCLESEEMRLKNKDSMNKLMGNLQELSSAIEQLQSKSKGPSK